jgi:hypothetical protein
MKYVREDGQEIVLELKEAVSVKTDLSIEAIRKGSDATRNALRDISAGLNESMTKRFLETVEEAADSVGNVVHGNGSPLTAELVLESWAKVELSFDRDGVWQPPTIVANPATAKKMREVLKEIEETPTLRARRDEIVNRQRENWRVREARRKLVD